MKLTKDYFNKYDTLTLAEKLIGKVFVHKTSGGIIKGIINETEAYTEDDEASQTYKGKKTKRNELLFKKAGHFYIYFTYGMYYCSNIVSGKENKGEGVLIRSVIPITGINIIKENRNWKKETNKGLVDGPAKFCIGFNLTKELNGQDTLENSSSIYIEDLKYTPESIKKTPRVGISKAIELNWRFISLQFTKK